MNWIVSIALIAISISLTAKIVKDLGLNKTIYSHKPGKCKYVPGIDNGSEDLISLSNGLVLISSGVYIPVSSHKQTPGKLYLYNPANEAASAEPLTIEGGSDWKPNEFFPVGVTAWETKSDTTVYVINSFTHKIHIFQLKLKEKKLVHKKTVSNEGIANPNNLIAVGPDRFYVTNFAYFSNPVGMVVELFTKLPLGSVWYFDGGKFVQVLDGLKGPNGIAISKSKKLLYVSAFNEGRLHVYKIQPSPANINLTLANSVDLFTGADNVNVDNEGALWIGCHPVAYMNIMHLYDQHAYSTPSQVLKVTFNDDHSKWNVEEVFADDGAQLQGSAAAVLTSNGKLVIGTVMHKTMVCEVGSCQKQMV